MTVAYSEVQRRMESQIPTPRCLILVNPKAGSLATKAALKNTFSLKRALFGKPVSDAARYEAEMATLSRISEIAAEIHLEANVETLPEPNRLPDLIQSAQREGFNTIVAAGGDGTVTAIAQHLVNTPLRLGIVPLGSANNLARALRVPTNMEEALRVVAAGLERSIDVGQIDDTYFLEAAGVGLFADGLIACEGKELYLWQIRRALNTIAPLCWNPHSRRLQIVLDGVAHEEEAVMVAVSNAAYLGEGFVVAPNARLTDGLLDVVILGAMNHWELLRFGVAATLSPRVAQKKVRRMRARSIEIREVGEADQPLNVHADERIVSAVPVRIEVVPRGLRILASHDQLSRL